LLRWTLPDVQPPRFRKKMFARRQPITAVLRLLRANSASDLLCLSVCLSLDDEGLDIYPVFKLPDLAVVDLATRSRSRSRSRSIPSIARSSREQVRSISLSRQKRLPTPLRSWASAHEMRPSPPQQTAPPSQEPALRHLQMQIKAHLLSSPSRTVPQPQQP